MLRLENRATYCGYALMEPTLLAGRERRLVGISGDISIRYISGSDRQTL
jgi:hypothetical protein